MIITAVVSLLLVINLFTFLVFWIDKRRAIRQEWRISEGTLLSLAFFGGWFGAKMAQRWIRHKTRKQPFASKLNSVPILWCVVVLVATVVPYIPQDWIDSFLADEPRQVTRSLPQIGF